MCEHLILENLFENGLFPLKNRNIVLFLVLLVYKIEVTLSFPSDVHVDGYQESEVPVYPFQQYIQVRKTYTVEHVPVYDQESPSPYSPLASSSNSRHTNTNGRLIASASNSGDHDSHSDGIYYQVPRLREEITDYKKQEVYEEKGYGDSEYDHHSYKEPTKHYDHNDYNAAETSNRATSQSGEQNGYPNDRQKYRRHLSLHTPDGSSTKILEYAASSLHDNDVQQKGIYAARSTVYCPEVIDFDLSSKGMGMGKSGNRKAKPRLKGLGSKIECLKNKYFGREPLPKAIFSDPSESRHSIIEVPSFKSFFDMVRHNVDLVSSFQNSKLNI